MFPMKQSFRTCHKNPMLTQYSLQCGGYGCIPGKSHGTKGNDAALTLEELQNALNVNCDTLGLNKDVVRSMVSSDNNFMTGYDSLDATNFLLGFATETDNTFQQGFFTTESKGQNIRVDGRSFHPRTACRYMCGVGDDHHKEVLTQ